MAPNILRRYDAAMFDPAAVKQWVGLAADVVQILAIIIGGVWAYMLFVKKRERFPRLELKHEIISGLFPDGRQLLHITLHLKNIGTVLWQAKDAVLRVQQILPLTPDLEDGLKRGLDPRYPTESEIRWPLLNEITTAYSKEKKPLRIEPGESDQIHYDVILQPNVTLVEVYSYVQNRSADSSCEVGSTEALSMHFAVEGASVNRTHAGIPGLPTGPSIPSKPSFPPAPRPKPSPTFPGPRVPDGPTEPQQPRKPPPPPPPPAKPQEPPPKQQPLKPKPPVVPPG
jgi:hypothetical protein